MEGGLQEKDKPTELPCSVFLYGRKQAKTEVMSAHRKSSHLGCACSPEPFPTRETAVHCALTSHPIRGLLWLRSSPLLLPHFDLDSPVLLYISSGRPCYLLTLQALLLSNAGGICQPLKSARSVLFPVTSRHIAAIRT